MSIAAMTWAFTLPLPPSSKLTLLAIADYADERAFCWPSIARLAEKTNQSAATVQRRLKELEQQGVLSRFSRFDASGRRMADELRLDLSVTSQRLALHPVADDDDAQANDHGASDHGASDHGASDHGARDLQRDGSNDGAPVSEIDGGRVDEPSEMPEGGRVANCDPPLSNCEGGVALLRPLNESTSRISYPLTPSLAKTASADTGSAAHDHETEAIDDCLRAITVAYPAPVLEPAKARALLAALTPEERLLAVRAARGYAVFCRRHPRRAVRDVHRLLRQRDGWEAMIALVPPDPPPVRWLPRGTAEYRALCVRVAIVRSNGAEERLPPLLCREMPPSVGVGDGVPITGPFPRGAEINLSRYAGDDGAVDTTAWRAVERGTAQFAAWTRRLQEWTGRAVEERIVFIDGTHEISLPDGRVMVARRRVSGLRVPSEWPPAVRDHAHAEVDTEPRAPPPVVPMMTEADVDAMTEGLR